MIWFTKLKASYWKFLSYVFAFYKTKRSVIQQYDEFSKIHCILAWIWHKHVQFGLPTSKQNMSQPISGQDSRRYDIDRWAQNNKKQIFLTTCFLTISSKYVQQLLKRSQKWLSQGGHLCWRVGPQNANLIGEVRYLLPVKFHQSLFGIAKKSKMTQSCQVLSHSVTVTDDKTKMSRPTRGQGGHHCRLIGPKKTCWMTLGTSFLSSFSTRCLAIA